MLTIEEVIRYYEEQAKKCDNKVNEIILGAERCKQDKEEYTQLAAWLRELQERRKAPEIVRCSECEHSRVWGCELYCTKWVRYTSHKGYCHRGAERRTE